MYILKNAFISITRNKGRNVLIGLIIMVISCATAVTLAIRSSATSLIESYENKYDVEATIGLDRESMRGKMKPSEPGEEGEDPKEEIGKIFSSIHNISVEEIKKYADSKYVKDYYYKESVGVNAINLEKATSTSENSDNRGGKEKFGEESTDFTLEGYSTLSAMEEFMSGKYKMTSGEMSENLEEKNCMINSELATLNEIAVGDHIEVQDPNDSENTLSLTVTGIFKEESEKEEGMNMFTSSVNTIITSTDAIESLTKDHDNLKAMTTPTFILTNKDVIEKFESELKEKGLSEYLSVTTNLDQVENATSTISNVSNFATTFLILTLIIGGIVLAVIHMINIRERKYEIGVLRTIGMKKSLLTLQFMTELLMIAFASLLLGAGVGAILSVPVSNGLLKQEIASAKQEQQDMRENFGGGRERKEIHMNGTLKLDEFTFIDAVVNLEVLGKLLVIGIVLTILSSSVSMISIQKFSPLTILKERS